MMQRMRRQHFRRAGIILSPSRNREQRHRQAKRGIIGLARQAYRRSEPLLESPEGRIAPDIKVNQPGRPLCPRRGHKGKRSRYTAGTLTFLRGEKENRPCAIHDRHVRCRPPQIR